MNFEGPEKKATILVDTHLDLRALPATLWHHLVALSNATILSTVATDACDAYLLSESALFVWSDRLILITCGQTRLIDAALAFVQEYGPQVRALFYQRKHERYPHLQPTRFVEDVARLQPIVPGQVITTTVGTKRFFYERTPLDVFDATTVELSMTGLQPAAMAWFGRGPSPQARQAVLQMFDQMGVCDGFVVDDHFFSPRGYSANGVRGDRYWTLHVTPEVEGSYASFETNLPPAEELLAPLLSAFSPAAHEVTLFSPVASWGAQWSVQQLGVSGETRSGTLSVVSR